MGKQIWLETIHEYRDVGTPVTIDIQGMKIAGTLEDSGDIKVIKVKTPNNAIHWARGKDVYVNNEASPAKEGVLTT
jgi:hypothetical protein